MIAACLPEPVRSFHTQTHKFSIWTHKLIKDGGEREREREKQNQPPLIIHFQSNLSSLQQTVTKLRNGERYFSSTCSRLELRWGRQSGRAVGRRLKPLARASWIPMGEGGPHWRHLADADPTKHQVPFPGLDSASESSAISITPMHICNRDMRVDAFPFPLISNLI